MQRLAEKLWKGQLWTTNLTCSLCMCIFFTLFAAEMARSGPLLREEKLFKNQNWITSIIHSLPFFRSFIHSLCLIYSLFVCTTACGMIERLCSSKLWLDAKLTWLFAMFTCTPCTYGIFSIKRIGYAHAILPIASDRVSHFNFELDCPCSRPRIHFKRVNSTINRIWKWKKNTTTNYRLFLEGKSKLRTKKTI